METPFGWPDRSVTDSGDAYKVLDMVGTDPSVV